ncbi:hypothetical protein SEA_ZAGIE_5 [Microbacterium phage Zagie]|nr:hypothetical protein SEA_ZAGIE_5 [Microbacterium phage Zagie]WNT45257.1 hypothetical protein SEA_BABYDOTZ_2 [Microbacterium phage BabyDotz]
MTTTTISVHLVIGSKVHDLTLVGDPADVMFATQLGRAISLTLLEHREDPTEGEPS